MTFKAVLQQPAPPPASATSQWINWLGVLCFGLMLAGGLRLGLSNSLLLPLLMLAYAVPIACHELYRQRGSLLPELTDGWAGRTVIRTLAHYFTFACITLLAWAMPWYQLNLFDSLFNVIDWRYAIAGALLFVFITPFYLMMVDHDPALPGETLDGGLALGNWLTGRRNDPRQRDAIKQHVLSWLVRFFFLPIMIALAWESLEGFSGWKWPEMPLLALPQQEAQDFIFETAKYLMLFVDSVIAVVGYLLSLRLFNSHMRSCDTSAFGWLVCILCYGPWWVMFYEAYVDYDDASYWQDWLAGAPAYATWIWGGLILFFTAIYLWATISFGIRFSNLTNRGIITNGPYALVKHPAYLSQNIIFWLTAIPFVPADTVAEAFRLSLLLLLVNLLYYFRAKTEEAHLRSDPHYVAYESWIAQHGLWAKIKRLIRI